MQKKIDFFKIPKCTSTLIVWHVLLTESRFCFSVGEFVAIFVNFYF